MTAYSKVTVKHKSWLYLDDQVNDTELRKDIDHWKWKARWCRRLYAALNMGFMTYFSRHIRWSSVYALVAIRSELVSLRDYSEKWHNESIYDQKV